jgi:hypothetical protein
MNQKQKKQKDSLDKFYREFGRALSQGPRPRLSAYTGTHLKHVFNYKKAIVRLNVKHTCN